MSFDAITASSGSALRPPCPRCGAQMSLARIEPEKPGHNLKTFECPQCEHSETVVVEYRAS